MYLLYDILFLIAMPFLLVGFFFRGLRRGRVRRGLRERFGFYRRERLQPLEGRKVIWIHAVSVGEARAAIPLLRALRQTASQYAVVMTTVTETGQDVARKIPEVDACFYFPFDFSGIIHRALRAFHPCLILIVETEIWPNLMRLAYRRTIPVVLVNGRFSDRSFPHYCWAGRLTSWVMREFAAFCMQTALDARRACRIGAPPERVTVTGNLKFDMRADNAVAPADCPQLREEFRLPQESLVWACGSTHEGEEEILLRVYGRLRMQWPSLILALAPRHPRRFRAVAELVRREGFVLRLRSEITSDQALFTEGGVLLMDVMGEMLRLYALADLVFVGGSLVSVGGHNVLEASLMHRAVLFGPHMHNFREIVRLLLEAEGGVQVQDEAELEEKTAALLSDASLRGQMGEHGFRLLMENQGATEKTMAILERLLPEP